MGFTKKRGKKGDEVFTDRVTKLTVKSKKNKTFIEVQYQRSAAGGGVESVSVKSPEPARPELHKAREGLKRHIVEFLGLPDVLLPKMFVQALSLDYDKVDGASAALPFVRFRVVVNLDGLSESWTFETPRGQFLRHAAVAIETVCSEALMYVRGERAQLDMFESDKPKTVAFNRSEMKPVAGVH